MCFYSRFKLTECVCFPDNVKEFFLIYVLLTGQNFEIAIDVKDYNALRAHSNTGELNHLVLCK